MNYVYPNGTSCISINGSHYDLSIKQTELMRAIGVDFIVFDPIDSGDDQLTPRGLNKVYACCRITLPTGRQIIVANMKRWVAQNFTETYGWVMMNLKLPGGYRGYKAEKLFKISVTASHAGPFSAIPLDQPEGHPWLKIDGWEE